ncbi:SRPBCC family protein [Streptomyces sp. A7024]|uniref:SRPBCC family protein n=1 Tax=Streptomyces coryli TaxID=1128680 RepID=A0A6G4U3M8_9ACTN|nr:SRPBCC family protein [Streptomyces coryli]NGN65897.1 SRPBCC family protein [Streptomyces coryli]
MARLLRPVPLGFADEAPVRMVFTRHLTAPPHAVYEALAEDTPGWSRWFAAVSRAQSFEGGRRVRLKGGIRFTETVLAAKPDERYAYRVEQTNAPGLTALLEDWRLSPTPGGTRVDWVWAADGPAPVRALIGLARPGLNRAFGQAMRALDERLSKASGQ